MTLAYISFFSVPLCQIRFLGAMYEKSPKNLLSLLSQSLVYLLFFKKRGENVPPPLKESGMAFALTVFFLSSNTR